MHEFGSGIKGFFHAFRSQPGNQVGLIKGWERLTQCLREGFWCGHFTEIWIKVPLI
jgi:hypothetical protein